MADGYCDFCQEFADYTETVRDHTGCYVYACRICVETNAIRSDDRLHREIVSDVVKVTRALLKEHENKMEALKDD